MVWRCLDPASRLLQLSCLLFLHRITFFLFQRGKLAQTKRDTFEKQTHKCKRDADMYHRDLGLVVQGLPFFKNVSRLAGIGQVERKIGFTRFPTQYLNFDHLLQGRLGLVEECIRGVVLDDIILSWVPLVTALTLTNIHCTASHVICDGQDDFPVEVSHGSPGHAL